MVKTVIFGASGYTGAELVKLVSQHPKLTLNGLYVSPNSVDAGKDIGELHPALTHLKGHKVQATAAHELDQIAKDNDVILLATPHEASHDWTASLLGSSAVVYDLSAAFRLSDASAYDTHYGFTHQHSDLLAQATYGLAEHFANDIASASLIALPGCYPTASLMALKPLVDANLLCQSTLPVINATSGVSGAGRKASLANSFCEVSLQAYGVFAHRHTPEIAQYLNREVIFTPHLGNFKRGILATITAKLSEGVSQADVDALYNASYAHCPLVRFQSKPARVDDVANTPFCDLYWQVQASNNHIIITSAIDNVLKGAASQAIQCVNLRNGWDITTGLLGSVL